MKGTILLNYNENTHQVEEEEKSRFLKTLLEQMFESTDVFNQIQKIWPNDGLPSVEQKDAWEEDPANCDSLRKKGEAE